jgi:hypothetical protein
VIVGDHSIPSASCCVFDSGDLHTFLEQYYIAFRAFTCHDQWSSVPLFSSELLGGPFSRYITMFVSTPMLGVLLLDCNATVRNVHPEFQQMTELSSVILWVRDQLCITEGDFFAAWDGIGSIQCCLYGELCITIHPWLLSVGECEFHNIALWCLGVKLWSGTPMGQQVKLLFLSCIIIPKAMLLALIPSYSLLSSARVLTLPNFKTLTVIF